MMKFVGAGLSKTGTSSLHAAMRILGFKSLHYDRLRLGDVIDGSSVEPDFRRYDDIDAVFDVPAAYFYAELLAAYPQAKCILTLRETDPWWRSISRHFNERSPIPSAEQDPFRTRLRNMVYGSTTACEFLYKKRYLEHNNGVLRTVPADRLLVMDVTAGDGWEVLCPFVGKEIPSVPFPHANPTPVGGRDYIRELYLADQEIASLVPEGQTFILVDENWWVDEVAHGRRVIPFLEQHGEYWGPPPDDSTAIAELERLRAAGANRIVFGWPAFWWLEHYRGFHQHLREGYPLLLSNERLVVFDLCGKS
jgi:hypothetical protein